MHVVCCLIDFMVNVRVEAVSRDGHGQGESCKFGGFWGFFSLVFWLPVT